MPRSARRLSLLVVPLLLAAFWLPSLAAEPIPLPNPIVKVTTKSGGNLRITLVPIGGLPVPIDVDADLIPDIDVSVGLLQLDKLPESPLVPSITVQRHATALALGKPAPDLEFDARVLIHDLLSALDLELQPLMDEIAEVHYGFVTPAGGRIPPRLTAKLTGPILQGFADPLEAKIEAPGYGGPLDLDVGVVTEKLDANFDLDFDPLPESIHFVLDPRNEVPDGLDAHYDHAGPDDDVELDASATLINRETDVRTDITGAIERLPRVIDIKQTTADTTTAVDVSYQSPVGKPDIEATYRKTVDDVVALDARLRAGGLPSRVTAVIKQSDAGVDFVDVQAPGGGEIDVVDLLARNHSAENGDPLPQVSPKTGAAQSLTAVIRRVSDDFKRWRATARVEHVRQVRYERLGESIDLVAKLGDGVKPMRAYVDLDSRGDGAPDEASRVLVDSLVDPLPDDIHVRYDPAAEDGPLGVLYEPSATTDVTATGLIAKGDSDKCGDAEVLCVTKLRVDDLPAPQLKLSIPTGAATDYAISHSGAQDPDVHAVVDTTPADTSKRVFADVRVTDIPNFVSARVVKGTDGLRAAEFHGCDWDYGTSGCKQDGVLPKEVEEALGRVDFTVRDTPVRSDDLPVRPDADPQHVTVVKEDDAFEAVGRVNAIKRLVFRRRAGLVGALGVDVHAGGGGALDVRARLHDSEQKSRKAVDVTVAPLPTEFSACVRPPKEGAGQPGVPAPDDLLDPCEKELPIELNVGEPLAVPLAVDYNASTKTKVSADVTSIEGEGTDDLETERIKTVVDEVPAAVRAVVIPGLVPESVDDPQRALQVAYEARDGNDVPATIDSVDLDYKRLIGDAVCDDPRSAAEAMCLEAKLARVPGELRASYQASLEGRSLRVRTTPGVAVEDRMDVSDLRLSIVNPGERLVLEGSIEKLAERLKAVVHDPEGDKPADRVRFDACPTPGWNDAPDPNAASCKGIGLVDVTVRKTPTTGPAEGAVEAAADDGDDDGFSLVARGEALRARARVHDLRAVEYSKVRQDDKITPSGVLRALLAFGDASGDNAIKATVDRVDGSESQLVDATVNQAPRSTQLCFRAAGDEPDGDGFCGQVEDPDKKPLLDSNAVQLVTRGAGDERPDITIDKLVLKTEGAENTYWATAAIEDLAERIDVRAATEPRPDIDVQGHKADDPVDATPVAVAKRLTFDFRTFDNGVGAGFPGAPLTGATDPADTPQRIADPDDDKSNVLRVQRDGQRLRLVGSVPDVRRVALRPDKCRAIKSDDARYPDFSDEFPPTFTCLEVDAARGRPLGLALRLLDDGDVTAVEDGFVSSMPETLSATIGKSPTGLSSEPVCGEEEPGGLCRPPLLSITAPKLDNVTPLVEGRLAFGPLSVLNRLRKAAALDELSSRIEFEKAPRSWGEDKGARVKVGIDGAGTAVRAGLRLDLSKHLDMDPLTLDKCKNNCGGKTFSNIALRIASSDVKPLGTEKTGLMGHVALWVHPLVDPETGDAPGTTPDIVLAGAPDIPEEEEHAPWNPDNLPEPSDEGDADLGFAVPHYLDMRMYLRKFEVNDTFPTGDITFLQMDLRSRRKLDIAARLSEPGSTLVNNDGKRIPTVGSFALRNLPATSGDAVGADDDPSFRMRLNLSKADPGPKFRTCSSPDMPRDLVGDLKVDKLVARGCVFGPATNDDDPDIEGDDRPDTPDGWRDVQIDAVPADGDPARRIDAVLSVGQDVKQAEITGYREASSYDPAKFSAKLGIKLNRFDFGAERRILISDSKWFLVRGNFAMEYLATDVTHARLAQKKLSVRVGAKGGGEATLRPKLESSFEVRHYAFGRSDNGGVITQKDGPSPKALVPVRFLRCTSPSTAEFGSDGVIKATGYSGTNTEGKIWLYGTPLQVLMRVAVDLGPCKGKPSDWAEEWAPDFDEPLPEPRPAFAPPDRPQVPFSPVPDQPGGFPGVTADEPAELESLVVSGADTVLCGELNLKKLTVAPNAVLRVGRAGEEIPVEGDENGTIECDGTLAIEAETIEIGQEARISASGAAGPGPGDGEDAGAGAGNAVAGGASGLGGEGGPSYGISEEFGVAGTLGSRGASAHVAGGAGGGGILLRATERIDIQGAVLARGIEGTDLPGDEEECERGAGGGGSGGGIHIVAPRVYAAAGSKVSAEGGRGGDGDAGSGGGGGSPGRIRIEAPIRYIDSLETDLSGGAAGPGGCKPGKAASGSSADVVALSRTALATGFPGKQEEWIGDAVGSEIDEDAEIGVRIRGWQQGGGPLRILVCGRGMSANAEGAGLTSPFLLPGGGEFTLDKLVNNGCSSFYFPEANVGTDGYDDIVTIDDVIANYVSFYAIAAKPTNETVKCDFPGQSCDFQEVLPHAATMVAAVDVTPPVIGSHEPIEDEPSEAFPCNDGYRCLVGRDTRIAASATDFPSDIDRVECATHIGGAAQPCDVYKTGGDGVYEVFVAAFDRAGNRSSAPVAKYLVDETDPEATLTVTPVGDEVEGYYRHKPTVKVQVADPGLGSGPDKLTLYVNGTAHELACETCTAEFLPDQGEIKLAASGTDRVGNVSPKTTAQPIKVDAGPPTTALLLGPQRPDGENGWYVTKPRIAFAVDDEAGGSGVVPGKGKSLTEFNVDGGEWEEWTPGSGKRLEDGEQTVCWRSTDVAGNEEEPVCTESEIKVDSKAPTAKLAVPAPNGLGNWFKSNPMLEPGAADAGSGVASAEVQRDGGAWTPMGNIAAPEGEHAYRVRVVDEAGNRSEPADGAVRVDTTNPTAHVTRWAPAPGPQGWFRRPVAHGLGILDDTTGSGAVSGTLTLDAGDPQDAGDGEVVAGDGAHSVAGRARDLVGHGSEPDVSAVKVDTVAPTADIALPSPAPLLLPGGTTTLRYVAGGTGAPKVKVRIEILSAVSHERVRTIAVAGGFKDAGAGAVTWDGLNNAGKGVLPGAYVYRVQVTDQAGNTAGSTESKPIVVGLTPQVDLLGGTLGLVKNTLKGLGL